MTLENTQHFFAQMGQVGLDQLGVANRTVPQLVGFQAAIGAHEQRRAQGGLDFLQRLGRPGLAD